MFRFPFYAFTIALLLFVQSGMAQKLSRFGIDTTQTIPTGLPEGMYAPLFSAKDADGNDVALQESLKMSPVILVFVQGSWSRYDRRYLKNLQDSLEYIGLAPAQVIVVTPERSSYLERFKERVGAEFPIVSDTDGSIVSNYDGNYHVTRQHKRRYNLFQGAKLSTRNAYDNRMLPVTAVYVISPTARITYRYFNYDRRQRPSVKRLLEHVNRPSSND